MLAAAEDQMEDRPETAELAQDPADVVLAVAVAVAVPLTLTVALSQPEYPSVSVMEAGLVLVLLKTCCGTQAFFLFLTFLFFPASLPPRSPRVVRA